jgi:hypothetical protein
VGSSSTKHSRHDFVFASLVLHRGEALGAEVVMPTFQSGGAPCLRQDDRFLRLIHTRRSLGAARHDTNTNGVWGRITAGVPRARPSCNLLRLGLMAAVGAK